MEPGEQSSAQLVHVDFAQWCFEVTFADDGAVIDFHMFKTPLRRGGYLPKPRLAHVEAAWAEIDHVPFSARMLDTVPVGAIVSTARSWLLDYYRRGAETMPEDSWRAVQAHWAERLGERPGRRGRPDIDYAHIALEYVTLVNNGHAAPVIELADRIGLSEARARNLLLEARKRGLLTATKAGKAGGRLTARAERLIEEADDGAR